MINFKLVLVIFIIIVGFVNCESESDTEVEGSAATVSPATATTAFRRFGQNRYTAYPHFRVRKNNTLGRPTEGRRRRIRLKAKPGSHLRINEGANVVVSTTEGSYLPPPEQENLIDHLEQDDDTNNEQGQRIEDHPLFQQPIPTETFQVDDNADDMAYDGEEETIWKIKSVEKHNSNNFDILYPNDKVFQQAQTINPKFVSLTNSTDLLISESSNPYVNSTVPFDSDFGLRSDKLQVLHPLLVNSDSIVSNVEAKIPENKTVGVYHELSESFGGTPVEPDIYSGGGGSHFLFNSDSIISTNKGLLGESFQDTLPYKRRKTHRPSTNVVSPEIATPLEDMPHIMDKLFGNTHPSTTVSTTNAPQTTVPKLSIVEIHRKPQPNTKKSTTTLSPNTYSTEISMVYQDSFSNDTSEEIFFEDDIPENPASSAYSSTLPPRTKSSAFPVSTRNPVTNLSAYKNSTTQKPKSQDSEYKHNKNPPVLSTMRKPGTTKPGPTLLFPIEVIPTTKRPSVKTTPTTKPAAVIIPQTPSVSDNLPPKYVSTNPPVIVSASTTTETPVVKISTLEAAATTRIIPKMRRPTTTPATTTTTSTTTTTQPPVTEYQPFAQSNNNDDLANLFGIFQQPQQQNVQPAQNAPEVPNAQPDLETIIQQAFLQSLLNPTQASQQSVPNNGVSEADLKSFYSLLETQGLIDQKPSTSTTTTTTTMNPLQLLLNTMLAVNGISQNPQPPQQSMTFQTSAPILPDNKVPPTNIPKQNPSTSPVSTSTVAPTENSFELLNQLLQLGSAMDSQKTNNPFAPAPGALAQPNLDLQALLAGNWLNGMLVSPTASTTTAPSFQNFDLTSLLLGNLGNNVNAFTTARSIPEFAPSESQNVQQQQIFNEFSNKPKPPPRRTGLYYWFDLNAFLGQDQSGGPMSGIRPKIGQKDYFLRVK